MAEEKKPQPPMTHKQRPAGTITIQPGESEEDAWEKLRQDNEVALQRADEAKRKGKPAEVPTPASGGKKS